MEPGDRFCSSKDLCKRTNPSVGQVKGTRLVARLHRASWDLSSYLVPHGTFFLDLAKGLLLSMGARLLTTTFSFFLAPKSCVIKIDSASLTLPV